jgi:hypothetical protein
MGFEKWVQMPMRKNIWSPLRTQYRHNPSFVIPDARLRIADAPLGAGPESILPAVVMDSGFAQERAPE